MSEIRKISYGDKPSLEVPATNESQLLLKDWISLIAKDLNIETKKENQLLIVVDEIFSNIVKYANVDTCELVKIEIAFNLRDKILELKFIDKGIAYNPLEAKTPDINAPIEERAIGGLGIFIVKKIMDSVDYKREGEFNILSLAMSVKELRIKNELF